MNLNGFSIKKIFEAGAYLQSSISDNDTYNYLRLIKLLFFADRYHIRKYGTLLTFDNYVALKLGPVASTTLNIIKREFEHLGLKKAEREFIVSNSILDKSSFKIQFLAPESPLLSKSEVEALDFAVENFSRFNKYELIDITHDYPEWKRYKDLFAHQLTFQEHVVWKDFFSNPNISESKYIKEHLGGVDPFYDDEEYLAEMAADFCQRNVFCIQCE
jgi:uncharacterized phage-associated protein